jgi:hypothetical protein
MKDQYARARLLQNLNLVTTGCPKTFYPLLAICLLRGHARVNLLIAKHVAPRTAVNV